MGLGTWKVLLLWQLIICCSACSEEERNSLLDFKQGINFTYSREQLIMPLESWRGLNCCSWEGVGCHPHSAHVITLDLGLSYIQWSEVRGGLFQLLHLEHLDLNHNYFPSLSIPPQIGELRRLKYLSLYYCEFAGRIPREVTKLQQLEHLDLSYNQLHGAIPREIGNISTLKFLSLSWNDGLQSDKLGEWITHLRGVEHLGLSNMNLSMAQDTWLGGYLISLANLTVLFMINCGLSGEIPPLFANLSRLQALELRGNSFTGNIPTFLGALPLSRLDLSSNKLNGSIPSALGNLSLLKDLELQNNSLSGPIPTSFARLSRLERLILSKNKLNGTFSFFILNNFPKLYGLDLSSNMLRVKISPSIIPEFQLYYLGLRGCNIEGNFPAFISTQYSIRYLDLSNNSLSGFIPNWLWGFTDIQFIDLSYNSFDGSIPKSIIKYTQYLACLSLAGNNLIGNIPASVLQLKGLDILDLSNNKFNGKIPQCQSNCSRLSVLNLEKNNLQGMIPNICEKIDSLETLKLGDNALEGYIPSSLGKCKNLQILDLRNNNLQGKISKWVKTLHNLQVLILKNNTFKGTIPSQLTKLQNLQILDMSINNFSGVIPKDFMKLTRMTNQSEYIDIFEHLSSNVLEQEYYIDGITIYNKGQEMKYVKILSLVKCLDLSSNSLSGNIPQNIGSLKGLIILNISRNHFSGEIPRSIREMTLLESLDLSQNNLSGTILTEIQLLTYLSSFNVSYNNLSGAIPQGGQMMTFSSSCFTKNSALCGLQINVSCSSSLPDSPKASEEDSEDTKDYIWWDMGMATGFVVSFLIVMGILWLNKTCSVPCFKVMDDIIISLL